MNYSRPTRDDDAVVMDFGFGLWVCAIFSGVPGDEKWDNRTSNYELNF
jgi:hypothetical protein